MKYARLVFLLLMLAVLSLTGCRYAVSESEDGTIVVNRFSGSVMRVGEDTVTELSVVNDPEFVAGSVVRYEDSIAGQVLNVTARVKLMSGLLLWYAEVEPYGQQSEEPDSEYRLNLGQLNEWTESGWDRITLILQDKDGFTVDEIDISLDDVSVGMADESGDVIGYRYEGAVPLPLEAIQLVDRLDFKWRLSSD